LFRIFLKDGEKKTVTFGISAKDLTLVGGDGETKTEKGEWKLVIENIEKKVIV